MIFVSANFKKAIKRIAVIFFYCVLFASCNQNTNAPADEKKAVNDSTINTAAGTAQDTDNIPSLVPLADSGKPYFKVAVYRNKEALAQYEGDWAIPLQSGKNMSIQFSASRQLSKIAHFMVLYFNSPSQGSFQIAPSGNEKGKPTLIFTQENDGEYGIGTAALSGTVNITNYAASQISGDIKAAGKDEKGNLITMQIAFVNLKNNISE
jgi:hypothetical protein